MADNRADFYYNQYNQRGGDFPVFQGARYVQYGNGFGDILRGIFRHVLPVVARGAANFLGGLVSNRDQGANWSAAAKSAILPTANAMLSQTADQMNQAQQRGSGKRRKKHRKKKAAGKRRRHKKRVYKGPVHTTQKRKMPVQTFPLKLPKYNF